MFLAHNTALAPPYRVLIDTNFINFSLQNKLELMGGMMDCLYAKCEFSHLRLLVTVHHVCGSIPGRCYLQRPIHILWVASILTRVHPGIPCVTDCVMAELEKLGHRYRVALRWVAFASPFHVENTFLRKSTLGSPAILDLNA